MPLVRTIAIGAAAGLVVLAGCSSSTETTATTTTAAAVPGSSTPSTGSSAPGTTEPGSITDPAVPIRTAVGQEFTITVEANPTTGYQWTVTGNPADSVAVPVGSTVTSAGTRPGEGGTETFAFKASGPGTTTITLTYARSFDPTDDPTVNEYTVIVAA